MACASLRYRSTRLMVVGVEPKGSKCNLKHLECTLRTFSPHQRSLWMSPYLHSPPHPFLLPLSLLRCPPFPYHSSIYVTNLFLRLHLRMIPLEVSPSANAHIVKILKILRNIKNSRIPMQGILPHFFCPLVTFPVVFFHCK